MDKTSTLKKTLAKFDHLVNSEIVSEDGWEPEGGTIQKIMNYSKTTFIKRSSLIKIIEVKLN